MGILFNGFHFFLETKKNIGFSGFPQKQYLFYTNILSLKIPVQPIEANMFIIFIIGGLITFFFVKSLKQDRALKQKYYVEPTRKANEELRAELDKLREERESGK